MTAEEPVPADRSAAGLVMRARNGDKLAWDTIVDRYAPLIWSICRRYRLDRADAEDIAQNVWLHLIDDLDKIRQPAALPGWLATIARRECSRARRAAQRSNPAGYEFDAETVPDHQAVTAEQELLAAERHVALREALGRLAPGCQRLLVLLIADPPLPYAEISARLGISVGSIGPTRARCLEKLRRDPVIAALIEAAYEREFVL